MTQSQTVRNLKQRQMRALERMFKEAYKDGFEAGLIRAHGQGRRGRTIRADATVEGLLKRIERHFGLARFGFEVRVVHAESGRRVPASDLLARYRLEE